MLTVDQGRLSTRCSLSRSTEADLRRHRGPLRTDRLRDCSGRFDIWQNAYRGANVIVFLASDAARAIHGAALPVTGLS